MILKAERNITFSSYINYSYQTYFSVKDGKHCAGMLAPPPFAPPPPVSLLARASMVCSVDVFPVFSEAKKFYVVEVVCLSPISPSFTFSIILHFSSVFMFLGVIFFLLILFHFNLSIRLLLFSFQVSIISHLSFFLFYFISIFHLLSGFFFILFIFFSSSVIFSFLFSFIFHLFLSIFFSFNFFITPHLASPVLIFPFIITITSPLSSPGPVHYKVRRRG